MTLSALQLAKDLIACPSVTPVDADAQIVLAKALEKLGFECHHLPFADVPNLFARLGTKSPHLCFAGHTDVVPPGPIAAWTHGPFKPTESNGRLIGRGACDMKGAVAAFAGAVATYLEKNKNFSGSISFLITGDEEGPAKHGTAEVLKWMKKNNHVPDVCIVGEPTNPKKLGDEIKIGRRGSLSGHLTVKGKQGHVAYQEKADNPLPRLIQLLDALENHVFDKGTKFFPPSNLEITTIDVGNKTENLIPGQGTAHFNIRYNDTWTGKTLSAEVKEILDGVTKNYEIAFNHGAESFLTEPGDWSKLIAQAVQDITGNMPENSTKGGASDARFIKDYCPVVEFGLVNTSAHEVDEYLNINELDQLVKVYARILELYF
jgi:succinyl-diaminopimelate desuccinylase